MCKLSFTIKAYLPLSFSSAFIMYNVLVRLYVSSSIDERFVREGADHCEDRLICFVWCCCGDGCWRCWANSDDWSVSASCVFQWEVEMNDGSGCWTLSSSRSRIRSFISIGLKFVSLGNSSLVTSKPAGVELSRIRYICRPNVINDMLRIVLPRHSHSIWTFGMAAITHPIEAFSPVLQNLKTNSINLYLYI